jgi:hypothetical protein
MLTLFVRFPCWPAVLGLLILAGCSSAPVLVSKDPTVPVGVDLSGRWIIRGDSSNQRFRANNGEERLIPSSRVQRSRRQRSPSGASVHVFIEFGKSLKITQTKHGIFISYDRSIVEEFTFGENRLVSIGPIEAMRISGWEEQSFVVETVDVTGTTLYEAWYLDADGAVLMRDVRISKGQNDSYKLQQVFDRQ